MITPADKSNGLTAAVKFDCIKTSRKLMWQISLCICCNVHDGRSPFRYVFVVINILTDPIVFFYAESGTSIVTLQFSVAFSEKFLCTTGTKSDILKSGWHSERSYTADLYIFYPPEGCILRSGTDGSREFCLITVSEKECDRYESRFYRSRQSRLFTG